MQYATVNTKFEDVLEWAKSHEPDTILHPAYEPNTRICETCFFAKYYSYRWQEPASVGVKTVMAESWDEDVWMELPTWVIEAVCTFDFADNAPVTAERAVEILENLENKG
jgi:hypothetical protein